jgi:hypothetical protein
LRDYYDETKWDSWLVEVQRNFNPLLGKQRKDNSMARHTSGGPMLSIGPLLSRWDTLTKHG